MIFEDKLTEMSYTLDALDTDFDAVAFPFCIEEKSSGYCQTTHCGIFNDFERQSRYRSSMSEAKYRIIFS